MIFICIIDSLIFLSTPSSQRATLEQLLVEAMPYISIHALFAEGDKCDCGNEAFATVISIHALFAEGDRMSRCRANWPLRFLSTPSSQRATRLV